MRGTRRRKQKGGMWPTWLFGKTKSAVIPNQQKQKGTMSKISDFFRNKFNFSEKKDVPSSSNEQLAAQFKYDADREVTPDELTKSLSNTGGGTRRRRRRFKKSIK